jgi:putative hemolysin
VGHKLMASGESSLIARLLSGSLASVLRRLGRRPSTEDEIQVLLKEGIEAGVFDEAEQEIVTRVFRLGDYQANALMTPMNEIVWLDIADSPEEMKQKITESPHSRFPVCEGSIDNILGIVLVKDLLIQSFRGQPFSLKGLLKLPLFIYEATPGLSSLDMFKKSAMHVAIVLDEYGSVRGLLTLNDIFEAIVGDMPLTQDEEDPKAVQRPDGSWLLDGRLSIQEFEDMLGITDLPEGDYQTLAGFVIDQIGRVPSVAARFESGDYAYEVVDMGGRRVDKVLVTRLSGRGS